MRTSWKQIRRIMARPDGDAAMRPANEFWSDFQARARLRNQEAPAPARPWLVLNWRPVTVAAAVVVLAASAAVLPMLRPTGPTAVRSLEVFASHSAVCIMTDPKSEGMVVWIVDMKTDAAPENGT